LPRAGKHVQSVNLTIKNLHNQVKQQKNGLFLSKDIPSDPFHFDELKQLWRQLAKEKEQDGKLTLYQAMIKRDLIPLSDIHYEMRIDNESQMRQIEPDKDQLLEQIRKKLNNYGIKIDVKLDPQQDNKPSAQKIMSGKDHFEHLAQQYPILNTLKHHLGLEIEY